MICVTSVFSDVRFLLSNQDWDILIRISLSVRYRDINNNRNTTLHLWSERKHSARRQVVRNLSQQIKEETPKEEGNLLYLQQQSLFLQKLVAVYNNNYNSQLVKKTIRGGSD